MKKTKARRKVDLATSQYAIIIKRRERHVFNSGYYTLANHDYIRMCEKGIGEPPERAVIFLPFRGPV